ncbi:MAG: type II toxin-antitoxin system RelE/ParE family toxin [Planctomycetes bacterium]|jgi:addiction module RelE/StbE family toxin|nr:type II toxin-antitoxin system RelE/ParE family toxin [Planctomycetota bacterium]
MAFRVVWSDTAVEDLKEIVRYIAQDDPQAAVRIAEHIFSSIERASEWPFSNRVVPEKAEESVREAILKPYRIVYQVDADHDTVHILRIWHAARGIPDLE